MKPYPKYKPTGIEWIGDIPEHWEVRKLKFVANVQPSNVDKKSDPNEIAVSLCNYMDVYKNEFINNSLKFMEATATKEEIEKFKIKKGDVVVTKDSETPDDIANSAYVSEDFENVICGYHLTLIRPESNLLSGEFLFRLFHAIPYKDQFQVAANGVTRFGLGVSVFSDAYVPLPPLVEQKAIATFLTSKTILTDKLISDKQKLIELLKEEKTALINQAVTKGINPKAKMKDSGIEWLGEIPEHWEVKKLKYVTSILRGKFSHRPRNDEKLYGGEFPFIQTGDVARASKFITEYSQTLNKLGYEVTKEFPAGSLVMTIAANIGDVAILTFNACFPDSIVGFKPHNKLSLEYLFYLLKSLKQEFIKTAVQNTQLNLNVERIENVSCPVPSLKEQTLIVNYVEVNSIRIDQAISIIENEITLLQEYRTALISEVVTGKVDIRSFKS